MSQNDLKSVLTKAPDCMGKNRLCGKTFFLFTNQAASNTVSKSLTDTLSVVTLLGSGQETVLEYVLLQMSSAKLHLDEIFFAF